MGSIFISYRRGDSAGHAGRLYDFLVRRYGAKRVIMDNAALTPGEDLGESIAQKIRGCDVMMAIIGRQWLSMRDRAGTRRLDDPQDFVRREIEQALDSEQLRIIPTCVDGASMPRADELPDRIRPLSHRLAIELSDDRWAFDCDRLAEHIDRAIASAKASNSDTPSASSPRADRPRLLAGFGLCAAGATAMIYYVAAASMNPRVLTFGFVAPMFGLLLMAEAMAPLPTSGLTPAARARRRTLGVGLTIVGIVAISIAVAMIVGAQLNQDAAARLGQPESAKSPGPFPMVMGFGAGSFALGAWLRRRNPPVEQSRGGNAAPG